MLCSDCFVTLMSNAKSLACPSSGRENGVILSYLKSGRELLSCGSDLFCTVSNNTWPENTDLKQRAVSRSAENFFRQSVPPTVVVFVFIKQHIPAPCLRRYYRMTFKNIIDNKKPNSIC